MILITVDLCIVIADLVVSNSEDPSSSNALQITDLVITIYFVVELTTRILVLTPTVFFRAWYNMVKISSFFCLLAPLIEVKIRSHFHQG